MFLLLSCQCLLQCPSSMTCLFCGLLGLCTGWFGVFSPSENPKSKCSGGGVLLCQFELSPQSVGWRTYFLFLYKGFLRGKGDVCVRLTPLNHYTCLV